MMKSMKFFAVLLTSACVIGNISPLPYNAREAKETGRTAGSKCLSLSLAASLVEQAGNHLMGSQDDLNIINRKLEPNRGVNQILDRAAAMKNVRWMPTKDLVSWDNKNTFKANTFYEGIPYAQTNQKDYISFISALNHADDFYLSDEAEVLENGKTVISPHYGVDCSGYVSFALDISRSSSAQMINDLKNNTGEICKVGDYDPSSPTKDDMYNAYKFLRPGNALVHYGHVVLVLVNNISSEEIVVYETTNYLPQVKIYTYNTLWNKGSNCYLPFCRK